MKKSFIHTVWVFSLLLLACNDTTKKSPVSKVAKKVEYHFTAPTSSDKYKLTDEVTISIDLIEGANPWDSVRIYVGNELKGRLSKEQRKTSWNTTGSKVGAHKLVAEVFTAGKVVKISRNVVLLSDQIPTIYTYKVIKKYPHDPRAFTQGLVYSKGVLYEGTGQKGMSELRKVELATGSVIKRKELSSSLFGEGITLYNDHIYQLTWQAGKGLVYDENTFEEISIFNYQGEGWGLTNNSDALIMSGGTHKIRFLDPGNFSLIKEIEVYDHKGAVGYLNELEWIDGKIYANVWQKDIVVIIDPESGKITGKVELGGLLPSNRQKPGVLNGIAYDKENKQLLVTGKYWPALFEIELVEKKTTSS